jgi:stage IV sporulation protein FB
MAIIVVISAFTGCIFEVSTLFGIVFIHELGHLACARYFGWTVTEIQLLPFGGVLHVEQHDQVTFFEEMMVALCGPLQHVWMIGLVVLGRNWGVFDVAWCDFFIKANLYIAVLNLIPIMPLDGGRIVQALLGYVTGYYHSLYWSVMSSLMFSFMIMSYATMQAYAYHFHLNLFVIGIFLLITNVLTYRQIPLYFFRFLMNRSKRRLSNDAKRICLIPITVTEEVTLKDTLQLFKKEHYHLVYVLKPNGRIGAVLHEQKLIDQFLAGNRMTSKISDLFHVK